MASDRNKPVDSRLTPTEFMEKLNILSRRLRLDRAAAIQVGDGYEFRAIQPGDNESIIRFLFSPSETEISKKLQEYFETDTANQDKLDTVHRILLNKVDDWLLVNEPQLHENLRISWQAQCYESKNYTLPENRKDISDKAQFPDDPSEGNINVIKMMFKEVYAQSTLCEKIGVSDGISPATAIMIMVITWISILSPTKTDTQKRLKSALNENMDILESEFRRAIVMADISVNRKKTQNKINVLQQKTDYMDMRFYEHSPERVGVQVNDNSSTKMLTLDA